MINEHVIFFLYLFTEIGGGSWSPTIKMKLYYNSTVTFIKLP